MSLDVNISEPDEFNCIELHDCIKSVADLENIEDFTYHVDIVSGKGENYIANVFRVTIQEVGSDKNVSVIVKTLVNTTRQELFRELHVREVFAYNEVINSFNILQNDISLENRIVLPKCIHSSIGKNNEVIILEDLFLSSFNIKLSKFQKLDYLDVRLIITELAKFHALTFVLEKKNENLESLRNDFEDLIFKDTFLHKTRLANHFTDSFQMSLNVIEDNEAKIKLQQRKENIIDVLRKFTKPRKYNVFCHGDCWINNILFKEGAEKEICFLDFQAMRYASPVTDILYFLYICTDSEFRSQFFADLKRDYYETLKSFLSLYEIDVSTVYPRDEFEADIKEMLPYGLLIALLELRIVTTEPEDSITTETVAVEQIENVSDKDRLYKIRVNDVINESINNGVLNQLLDLLNQ